VAQAKIDPELSRQLDQAALTNSPVQAVIKVSPEESSQLVASPEHTAELANQVVGRISSKLGIQAERMTLFRNLGSFSISAAPQFVRELIDQPEVAGAIASRQPSSSYIAPINARPVELSEIGHEQSQPVRKKKMAVRRSSSSRG
jgi:hypothetical protein